MGLGGFAMVPAGLLSSGLQRRLALARLLVAARPLWLLDEPTTALDAAARALVVEMIRDHLAGGGLAVIATHHDLGLVGAPELSLAGGA